MLHARLSRAVLPALVLASLVGPVAGQEPAQEVCENGVRIWSFPDDGGDRFLMMVLVGVGSRHETGATGIAHFLEHVLFTSTTKGRKADLDRELRRRGGSTNGFTSHDVTAYYLRSSTADWRYAVDWLADHLVRPAFLDRDIETERRIVYEELDMRQAHAGVVTVEALLYPDHPLGRNVGGDKQGLANIRKADLVGFYETHYRGGNVAVGFAGRVPRKECVEAIRQAFAPLPAGDPATTITPPDPLTGRVTYG